MTHPDTEIAGTSLHRVHMEAQDEPLWEPWTLIWLLAEIAAGLVVGSFVGILAAFFYANWPVVRAYLTF